MSMEGTARDTFRKIAEMLPLSQREKTIAQLMMNIVEEEDSLVSSMKDEASWWGEAAIKGYKAASDISDEEWDEA